MGRARKTKTSMTAAQLKKFRQDHAAFAESRSQVKMAEALGINVRTYINYEVGDMPIPEPIAKLVRCLSEK